MVLCLCLRDNHAHPYDGPTMNVRYSYEPSEPQLERDQYNATVSDAFGRGIRTVVPYIALGCGWVSPGFEFDNNGTMAHHGTFDDFLAYDKRYSSQLGAQVNRPEYASSDFGEWGAAEYAVFYPSPLDTRGRESPTTQGSTHFMDHLLAYVRGATGSSTNDSTKKSLL